MGAPTAAAVQEEEGGVSDRRTILDRIRHCGRLGNELEARRLYLMHGVDFRQYRSAYETGRQEARQMQPMLREGARHE